MFKSKTTYRQPWNFIPSLYFAEGIPYILINTVSVIMFKNMGIDNASIAFWTSMLYLPWVIKMFWGPLVDNFSTKRNWIIYTQLLLTAIFAVVAFAVQLKVFFFISLLAFFIGAFISATHDIAADGFYLLSLTKEDQAKFVGIRSTFYRIAMIFGNGVLVYFAGHYSKVWNNIPLAWSAAFGIAAVLFALAFIYHKFILPFPVEDHKRTSGEKVEYIKLFKAYFTQPKIIGILAFILFYRFGEALLVKMAAPFLMDAKEKGGLGLTTEDVGIAYGTIGVICLLLGGIVGGWIISKYGLRKMIWPMAIILNIPHAAYLYMSMAHPPAVLAYPLIAIEQFGYGFGFTAFMVFLMYISKGEYKTTFYAISTGIMALGMMIPGAISGWIQEQVGYVWFFIIVLIMAIPGLLTLFFIPLEEIEEPQIEKK